MSLLRLSLARLTARSSQLLPPAARRFSSRASLPSRRQWFWGACVVGATTASFALAPTIYNDAVVPPIIPAESDTVDPATSISFPNTIRVPSKVNVAPLSLLGLGVRTVSFLGIKVYSVAFYADLANPNLKISKDMPVEEKIDQIVRNTACVIRIVPTRSTSYTHLRDAFMRALQNRMVLGKQNGTLTEEVAQEAASPMRKLKSLFPNSPLAKHTPLDIFLAPPISGRPRALVVRDLGSIENDWVATEFVLHYFEGKGVSPPLKDAVVSRLENFEK